MKKINRRKVFAAFRLLIGGGLTQAQVDGTNYLLDAIEKYGVTDPTYIAYILASVYYETGGYMLPIKETVYASHKNKNPSDRLVKARLEKAWQSGKLGSVKTPYWREGWFGRGMIQITHLSNYRKLAKRLNKPLDKNPNLALDPAISADIAVVGTVEGLFTGKKLSDYLPGNYKGARYTVNGQDKASTIATYARVFEAGIEFTNDNVEAPATSTTPETDSWITALIDAIIALSKSLFGEKK